MQLNVPDSVPSLRARLRAAACILLAAGAPVIARAETPAPSWQFDATGLAYTEKARTTIVEPVARITRLFPDGQAISAGLTFDAMTGASPSGAQPTDQVVTTTSASGNTSTSIANQVPTKPFRDIRGAFDLDWVRPIGPFTLDAGGLFSRERDYQSMGWHGKGTLDFDHHLSTVSFGGGVNHDLVFPMGGTPAGLTTTSPARSILTQDRERKTVTDGMLALSRVLTRRWLLGLNGERVHEQGYLTEPYKIVSLLDGTTGTPVVTGGIPAEVTERRPTTRNRSDVLASSVYHFADDVLYTSYRYYWDNWGVKSHTIDLRYRADLPEHDWLQPHVRYYAQSQADFFVFGLTQGAPLPEFATSDFRLGPLQSLTLGVMYGCPVPNSPGELTIRGEYMRQWGDGHPANATGTQRSVDLFPSLDTFSLIAGYSVQF